MALATVKEEIIDHRWSRTIEPWNYKSAALGRMIRIPALFVYDHESIPIIRGTSKRAGMVHDYLSRFDSIPVVSKRQAARIYREVMTVQHVSWWRKWGKWAVVLVWRGYFHVYRVYAQYSEMTGRKWPTP